VAAQKKAIEFDVQMLVDERKQVRTPLPDPAKRSYVLQGITPLRTIQQRQPVKDARTVWKGGLRHQSRDRPARRHKRASGACCLFASDRR
jgi:hypothetical protein